MQLELTTDAIPYGYCHCGCGGKTNLAPQSVSRTGWVKGEPVRYIAGHNGRIAGRMRAAKSPVHYLVEDRGYVTPCWVWQRNKNHQGYGMMRNDEGKMRGAHRVYYERHIGPIPEGLQLDHLCRVRACVNPSHLEPVTAAENSHRSSSAKLTAADVIAIRSSGAHKTEIAAKYEISPNHVDRIRSGREWASVSSADDVDADAA